MIRTVYFICEFLFTYVKCWLSFELISALSEHRVEKKNEIAIKLGISLAISALYIYNSSIISVLFSSAMMVLVVVLLTIATGITCRCKFLNRFVFIYFFWLCVTMVDFFVQTLTFMILSDFGEMPNILLMVGYARSFYMCISTVAVSYVGGRVVKWIREVGILRYRKWLFFTLAPLSIVMIYFQKIYKLEIPETLMNRWWLVIFCVILGGLLFGAHVLRGREDEERRLQQLKLNMLENNYQSLLQIYEEKAILLHDTKNHLQIIQEMVTEDQKEELLCYIRDITGKMQGYRNHDYANHKLMNLILGMKIHEAENADINVEFGFDDMATLQLKPMELCAILSNLLDNAIEANLKIPEIENRWMKIYCVRKNHMMVLTISNPICDGAVNEIDGNFLTTKKDKSLHGFGMRSIKRIVENYDGYMRVDTQDNKFVVTLYVRAFDTD